jgi:hypothetical protein
VVFPNPPNSTFPSDQGDITPDGNGNIMIAYINLGYSGALFRKVAGPSSGGPPCIP